MEPSAQSLDYNQYRLRSKLSSKTLGGLSMHNSWFRFPVFYFLVTAAAGVVLRAMALLPSWQSRYEPLLHAHSHIALLGWGYTAIMLLMASCFLTSEQQHSRFFRVNWICTQLTVISMFIAFSLQGYGFFSILFSTIHIFLSYGLGIWMWRQFPKKISGESGHLISIKFAKASLFFMMLSSAGPWALAALSAMHLHDSPWYQAAIYFYLHFQYNGWFTLSLFAVLYSLLEQKKLLHNSKLAQLHFILYITTLLPAYLLSLLWMKLPAGWVSTAIGSGILQLASAAAFFLLWLLFIQSHAKQLFTGWSRRFLNLSLLCLALKMVLELGSAVPALEPLVFSTRSVVIGYLHLVLLGFVSCMIIAFALQMQWLAVQGKVTALGLALFISGFLVNELVLFIEGLLHWTNSQSFPLGRELLFLASLLLLLGIAAMGWSRLMRTRALSCNLLGAKKTTF
jgi:hypothetical protein